MAPDRLTLIRGSGVDLDRFAPSPEPPGPPVAALVGRMLAVKGVADLAAAARLLRQRGVALRLWLAGPSDADSPSTIPPATLRGWQAEGLLEWHGPVGDIADLWRRAHIAVLPSQGGEGLPKALLEAAAAGRPIVATDVPGCREIVRPEETGLLVPRRDPAALADALARLAADAACANGSARPPGGWPRPSSARPGWPPRRWRSIAACCPVGGSH